MLIGESWASVFTLTADGGKRGKTRVVRCVVACSREERERLGQTMTFPELGPGIPACLAPSSVLRPRCQIH